jgi:hypothetical protein
MPEDPLAEIAGPLRLSSNTGERMSYSVTERLITETTRLTLGVALSPHLFRSCAATAIYTNAGDNPNIASADLRGYATHRWPHGRHRGIAVAKSLFLRDIALLNEPGAQLMMVGIFLGALRGGRPESAPRRPG